MAKSKVKRGFLYYLIMFLAFVFGVFCILGAILIFNPGEDVYGINLRYVTYRSPKEIYRFTDTNTRIGDSTYNTVEFDSIFTNFNIEYDSNESNPKILFRPMINALSRSEKINLNISVTLVGTTIKISLVEPELWLGFSTSSTVTFVCPKNKSFSGVNFDISTESGTISFGDSTKNSHSVKSINATTKTGTINVYENVTVTSGNATLTTETGRISYNNPSTKMLDITTTSGKINIDEIGGDLNVLDLNGTLELNANKIGGNAWLESKKGYIKIKELGSSSSNGNFTTKINCELTNIEIGKMYGNATIDTTAGYVAINNIAKRATIKTQGGNIDVKKTVDNITAITKGNGAVTIHQHSASAITNVLTENGRINVYLANIGNVELTTDNSNIDIQVVTGEAFTLNYYTKHGITASWSTIALNKADTLYVSGATAGTSAVVTATATNGRINVREGYVVA